MRSATSLYAGGEPPPALQLYDWARGTRVGVEVPAPLVMAWDPSLSLVALAYTSQVRGRGIWLALAPEQRLATPAASRTWHDPWLPFLIPLPLSKAPHLPAES